MVWAQTEPFPRSPQGEWERDNRPVSVVVTFPMVQVGGPLGNPTYVYRPWTEANIVEATKHLPQPNNSCHGKSLNRLFPRLRPNFIWNGQNNDENLLTNTVRSCQKVCSTVIGSQRQSATTLVTWPTEILTRLVTKVTEDFKTQCDLPKVSAFVQAKDEGPRAYFHRLMTIWQPQWHDQAWSIPWSRNHPLWGSP